MAKDNTEFTNWVDPDVLAEYEGQDIGYNQELEEEFKKFFETGWLDPKFDDLREHWDPLIHDQEPKGRLYGKIALWSLVRLRAIQSGIPFELDKPQHT